MENGGRLRGKVKSVSSGAVVFFIEDGNLYT